jgi:uncharacterized oligopeptide transporter (OPT) family protein
MNGLHITGALLLLLALCGLGSSFYLLSINGLWPWAVAMLVLSLVVVAISAEAFRAGDRQSDLRAPRGGR